MTSSARVVFPGLDTMRAVAPVAVVGTHTAFWAGYYDAGLLGAMSQRLEVGVTIFFVLSGFLLSRPWWVSLSEDVPRDTARRYLLKRALRVLPVYWVTVVAGFVLIAPNRDLSPDRWVANLLLVDLYRGDALPHGLTQMWSLTTEVAFYLVLPLLMWALVTLACRHRWRPVHALVVLGVLAVGSEVWNVAAAGVLQEWNAWTPQALPGHLGWFGAGIALALLEVDSRRDTPVRGSRVLHDLARAPGSCWLLAAAAFTVASTPLAGQAALVSRTASEAVCRSVLYALVAVLVLLPSIFGDPASAYARTLARPALRHLGHLSYSVFCCHVIVLEVLFRRLDLTIFDTPALLLFLGVLAISLAVSEVLYRLVERPCLRLKDARWVRRLGTTTASEPSAATTRS